MSDAIIVALISSAVTLFGTILTVVLSSRKQAADFAIRQARMEERLDSLSAEVHKHNNFAERLPVLEEKIKVANHRIDSIEEWRNQN